MKNYIKINMSTDEETDETDTEDSHAWRNMLPQQRPSAKDRPRTSMLRRQDRKAGVESPNLFDSGAQPSQHQVTFFHYSPDSIQAVSKCEIVPWWTTRSCTDDKISQSDSQRRTGYRRHTAQLKHERIRLMIMTSSELTFRKEIDSDSDSIASDYVILS